MTTKEQERNALEKIRKIVTDLGENSYVATALKGCFALAEQNIEYDATFSLKEKIEIAERATKQAERERDVAIHKAEYWKDESAKFYDELEKVKEQKKAVENSLKRTRESNEQLQSKIEGLSGWEICKNTGTQLAQGDYEEMKETGGSISESDVIKYIADEFGFNADRIEIIKTVQTFEVNKATHRMRIKGTYEREPLYVSTDWNYARFDVGNWYYEMINGQIHQYYC